MESLLGRSPSFRPARTSGPGGWSGRVALAALCGALWAPPLVAAPSAIDAVDLLRRAEEVRSPTLDYAVDFTIALRDDSAPGVKQSGAYTMIARGKNRSMVLILEPKGFYGATMLIRDGEYWFVTPKATKPFQLSAQQVLSGDVSNGDLARADLLADYEPRLDGEEPIVEEICWRMELRARSAKSRYPRVRAWVTKKKFLPRKLEFYGLTGDLIKTAHYEDYQKTPLGLRSMRLDVESSLEMNRKTTMVFTNLRKVDASPVEFSPEGMLAFRDAALAKMNADGVLAHSTDLLKALAGVRK